VSSKLLVPKILYFSSNIVDKKWFENLLALKIERLVNVDINANSTTILIVSLGFSFCILLICGGLCAYATYNCKWRKPAKKQVGSGKM